MFYARAPRIASSAARVRLRPRTQLRFQSTSTGGTSPSHFASGVAGGVAGASLLYGIYLMTPSGKMVRKINTAAKEADKKYQQVASTIKDKTPTTDEAIEKLKQVCYSYVAWVPGGRQYVDTAFNDLATIRENHGQEVDKIVTETYREFQDVAKSGLSLETASKAYDALANLGKKLAGLTGSAADDLLERHPQLNDRVGEPIRQLKQMAAQYGPEAKKMADETWNQVNDVMASGFSAESADKVRKLVEDRTQQLRKIGDDLWEKGLEQAKPYLDKSPRVKELVMGNKDVLKEGNVGALFKQIRSLGEGGDAGKLEEYVKQAVDKAKQAGRRTSRAVSGSGFASLGQFVGASDDVGRTVKDNIQLLTEVVDKHSDEGKELLDETRSDLRNLLEEKAKKAQKIIDNAKKE